MNNFVPLDPPPRGSVHSPRFGSEVYRVPEVAELLGLSRGSTYELVREGTIPARRLGRRWVIPKASFAAWLSGSPDAD